MDSPAIVAGIELTTFDLEKGLWVKYIDRRTRVAADGREAFMGFGDEVASLTSAALIEKSPAGIEWVEKPGKFASTRLRAVLFAAAVSASAHVATENLKTSQSDEARKSRLENLEAAVDAAVKRNKEAPASLGA